MVASNTKECFRECIGKRVIGVLFDAMPPGRTDIASGTKTLLFDDGSGLTISSKGTFWVERPVEVKRAIGEAHSKLCRNQRDLKDVLDAAGVLLPAPTGGSCVSQPDKHGTNHAYLIKTHRS
jgi:hypothetical protein